MLYLDPEFSKFLFFCRMEKCRNSNMYLSEAAKSGKFIWPLSSHGYRKYHVSVLYDQIYTRIFYRFMVIPDMLKNAPMFKRLDARIKVCNVNGCLSYI